MDFERKSDRGKRTGLASDSRAPTRSKGSAVQPDGHRDEAKKSQHIIATSRMGPRLVSGPVLQSTWPRKTQIKTPGGVPRSGRRWSCASSLRCPSGIHRDKNGREMPSRQEKRRRCFASPASAANTCVCLCVPLSALHGLVPGKESGAPTSSFRPRLPGAPARCPSTFRSRVERVPSLLPLLIFTFFCFLVTLSPSLK